MVDTSFWSNFKDAKKKSFMQDFVLPAAVNIFQKLIKVKSNSIIPAFDPVQNYCDDEGKITIDAKYKTQTTTGDFILFAGVFDNEDDGTLAYATFCVLGNSNPII